MDRRSKVSEQMLPFFVYGTLLSGQPNSLLWQGLEVNVRKATLANGRLHDLGGYPILVEIGADPVKGQVVTIAPDFYKLVVARLDLLEGYDPDRPDLIGYRRLMRDVMMEDGRTTSAWVYVGQIELVNGRAPIPNGDWATYVRQKNQPWNSPPPIRHPFNPQDF